MNKRRRQVCCCSWSDSQLAQLTPWRSSLPDCFLRYRQYGAKSCCAYQQPSISAIFLCSCGGQKIGPQKLVMVFQQKMNSAQTVFRRDMSHRCHEGLARHEVAICECMRRIGQVEIMYWVWCQLYSTQYKTITQTTNYGKQFRIFKSRPRLSNQMHRMETATAMSYLRTWGQVTVQYSI